MLSSEFYPILFVLMEAAMASIGICHFSVPANEQVNIKQAKDLFSIDILT